MRVCFLPFFLMCLAVFVVSNARAASPSSRYGLVQNVQDYSSNPFWSPDAPYNLRMPTAVYAMGTDIETDECQRVVASLVTTQCAQRNNCISAQVADIRPAVMLQLSRMSGGNYATACGGYIDSTFYDYVEKYGNAMPVGVVAFPAATVPNTSAEYEFEIENPYEVQTPEWQSDMMERRQELLDLQSQNGNVAPSIERSAFPTTYADLSFSDRMANAAEGYAPYKDAKAYRTLKIESQEDAMARADRVRQLKSNYCKQNAAHLAKLKQDLTTLKNCRTKGTKVSDCKLQGKYL